MKLTPEEIEKCVSYSKDTLIVTSYLISNDDIHLFCRYLKVNKNITTLKLGHNDIGDEGAKVLAENITIATLVINNNYLGVDAAKALAVNSTITTLDISGNSIGIEGVKALARNTTIATLILSRNKIGAEGAEVLAANTTITTLDVSSNDIGDTGAKALAENNTIKKLIVFDNNISVEGIKALIANNTITSLDIRCNRIGDEKVSIFINALKNNYTLVELLHSFEGWSLKDYIIQIITRNKALPWIYSIRHARLMAQAQRSENCLLGILPTEILGMINDYAVGANHFSFFIHQFDKRPTAQDLVVAKKMMLS